MPLFTSVALVLPNSKAPSPQSVPFCVCLYVQLEAPFLHLVVLVILKVPRL